jgi:hypothetical protein
VLRPFSSGFIGLDGEVVLIPMAALHISANCTHCARASIFSFDAPQFRIATPAVGL